MSAIKIGTQKELEKFLRILAEESVTAAHMTKNSAADMQKSMAARIQHDKSMLSEEDPEKEAPAVAPEKKAPAPAPEKPAAPAAAKTPKDAEGMDINPTLDSLMRAINEMRSGFATTDRSIESEISKYFDRLEEAERVSLVVMLRSLGNIMRNEETGDAAAEPEQYNVIMSMKAKEKPDAPPPPPEKAAPGAAPKSAPPEGEETQPPIQVNQPVSESYRNKIRHLLRQS